MTSRVEDANGKSLILHGIRRLRAEGLTDEQIIDLVAEIMAETLPERD